MEKEGKGRNRGTTLSMDWSFVSSYDVRDGEKEGEKTMKRINRGGGRGKGEKKSDLAFQRDVFCSSPPFT